MTIKERVKERFRPYDENEFYCPTCKEIYVDRTECPVCGGPMYKCKEYLPDPRSLESFIDSTSLSSLGALALIGGIGFIIIKIAGRFSILGIIGIFVVLFLLLRWTWRK